VEYPDKLKTVKSSIVGEVKLMDFISTFFFIAWMVVMMVGMLECVFIVFRCRHVVNGRVMAIQVAAFMTTNTIFAILFTMSIKLPLEQSVLLAVPLVIITVIGAIAGYWVGKKMEEEREGTTGKTLPETQNVEYSGKRESDGR
jgi:hypothetical protein